MKGKLYVPKNNKLCAEDSTATETEFEDSDKINSAPCYITPNDAGGLDFFYVETLLAAANTDPDAIRKKGTVLTLTIDYTNISPWSGASDEVRYVYKLDSAPKSKYKEVMVDTIAFDQNTRLIRKLYGVQLSVTMTGQLGRFDFSTLLVTATTALALLAVATTVVDALALYFLPQRSLYQGAKYEFTEDFSDLRERLVDDGDKQALRVNNDGASPAASAGMDRSNRVA